MFARFLAVGVLVSGLACGEADAPAMKEQPSQTPGGRPYVGTSESHLYIDPVSCPTSGTTPPACDKAIFSPEGAALQVGQFEVMSLDAGVVIHITTDGMLVAADDLTVLCAHG